MGEDLNKNDNIYVYEIQLLIKKRPDLWLASEFYRISR